MKNKKLELIRDIETELYKYSWEDRAGIQVIAITNVMDIIRKNLRKHEKKDTTAIRENLLLELQTANKDIDLIPDREEYTRGYLAGGLAVLRIFQEYFGKFIDDDEIYKEGKE